MDPDHSSYRIPHDIPSELVPSPPIHIIDTTTSKHKREATPTSLPVEEESGIQNMILSMMEISLYPG